MTAHSTYETSIASNHASAEAGGITFNTGATVAVPGNGTTWSRAMAKSALGAGSITQAQYVAVMQAISGWEEAQNSLAKATLRNGGDSFPA